jgi:nucleoside phosphorylase
MMYTVLILTPLPVEYAAMRRHISDLQAPLYHGAAAYEVGMLKAKHHQYKVVLREPGMYNTEMALATEQAIQHFKPHIVLLVGIAGGVKDVAIADVVIATKTYGYEQGKEDVDGFKARPAVGAFSQELLARCQTLSRNEQWKQRTHTTGSAAAARILLGPIAAGNKVVAATDNDSFQRIKRHYNDTLALEMEAIGFATALHNHITTLHGLAIRGISDLCAGKAETDQHNWQPVAADHAAAVAVELLVELDASNFITLDIMEIKDLVKDIYGVLFPAALKEIHTDFVDAVNGDIRALWKRVKPYFIEEVQELATSPDDEDAQAAVRNKLKKAVEADSGLRGELEGMVGKVKESGVVSVVGSKNVIVGGNFDVKGDFRVGDGFKNKNL